jgi:hypothetical protein
MGSRLAFRQMCDCKTWPSYAELKHGAVWRICCCPQMDRIFKRAFLWPELYRLVVAKQTISHVVVVWIGNCQVKDSHILIDSNYFYDWIENAVPVHNCITLLEQAGFNPTG